MRILLIYPGHTHCTIDVARGHEAALRALGHTVRAYNYHNSLAFYQEALAFWATKNPSFDPEAGAHLLLASEHAVIEAIDFVPDVILIVSGFSLHKRAFDLLGRLRVPVALLTTESPYADELQAKIITAGGVQLTFANDLTSLDNLPGLVVYLPHSYDPARHYPRSVNGEHQSDVFFHGTLWPERKPLIEVVREFQPEAVRVTGIDPALATVDNIQEQHKQFIDNDELANYYCGTKIALNHHRTLIGTDDDGEARHIDPRSAYSLGPRAFEIAACGAFQLCDDTRPELAAVFGDSVATYRDAGHLREQLAYYLTHETERREMAAESLRRVADCTFEDRARDIIIPALEMIL